MTGLVLSNDGDVAIVRLEDGHLVRFERQWAVKEKTKEQFRMDMPVGPLPDSVNVERLNDGVC